MAAVIRAATADDLPGIAAIYNHEVATSTATLDTDPMDEERLAAFARTHEKPRFPLRVAEAAGVVVGWAALSPWSDRCGYARAAEVSIYVHKDHRGRGVGGALLDDLIDRGRGIGLGVLLARIVGGRERSLALHRHRGFTDIGVMRRVGEKFGDVLDVELFELQL